MRTAIGPCDICGTGTDRCIGLQGFNRDALRRCEDCQTSVRLLVKALRTGREHTVGLREAYEEALMQLKG